ncbi:MAG: methyltransferase domain-containing protein [Gammaproteobacteria bacterium]
MSEPDQPGTYAFRRRDVRRRADESAGQGGDFLSRHTRSELLGRLSLTTLDPRRVLDAGAATGAASRELAARYRQARVVSMDLSPRRMAAARRGHGRFARRYEVVGDAARLPFRGGVFDLVFANLLLPFFPEPQSIAREVARVLRPEGLFTFSSLGPDSFLELREAWRSVGSEPRVPAFLDMHDIGDALVAAGFRDPVLDVERLTITYGEPDDLWRDLRAAGARNTLAERRRGLATPGLFRRATGHWERSRREGRLPLSVELVYGHCWGGNALPASPGSGEIRISPDRILRRS